MAIRVEDDQIVMAQACNISVVSIQQEQHSMYSVYASRSLYHSHSGVLLVLPISNMIPSQFLAPLDCISVSHTFELTITEADLPTTPVRLGFFLVGDMCRTCRF